MTGYVLAVLATGAVYLGAMVVLLRRGERKGDLALILLVALILRGLAMTVPHEIITTDALRYVWDGRVQAAGFSPYLYAPADERLVHLRDAVIFPGINQKETAVTIYPPFAQVLFLLTTRIVDSVEGMKLLMLAAEALTVWALMAWLSADGLPRTRVVLYAWHPLPIWELASQAHIDAVVACLAILAVLAAVRGRQGVAGAILGLAVATKYFPLVLGPVLWRRWDWRMPAAGLATLAVLYLPYVAGAGPRLLGFFGGYLDNEGYGAGWGFHVIWYLRDLGIADPPPAAYVGAVGLLMLALGLRALLARKPDEIRPEGLLMMATVFVVATSPHYPWYFTILVPLLVRVTVWPVLLMTLLCVVLYLPRINGFAWSEIYALIYAPPLALAAASLAASRVRRAFAGLRLTR